MNITAQIENIKEKISGKISFNENLSKLSWFNLGGPAFVLFKPKNINELSYFLREIKGIKEIMYPGQNKYNRYKNNSKKEIAIPDIIKKDLENLIS